LGEAYGCFRVLKVRFLSGVGQPNQSWVVSATEPDLKMKDHILIAGGSGFVGQRLTSLLQESGHQVSWLSRKSGQEGAVNRIAWDPSRKFLGENAFDGITRLVILSGEGIADKRWTDQRKQLIIDSRVQGISLLKEALLSRSHTVRSIVSASAVGFYGTRGHELLDETSTPGAGFLSTSVQTWEEAAHGLEETGLPVAIMRIGLVLGRGSGVWQEMDNYLRFGIRPIFAAGKQWWPWIHLEDVAGIFQHSVKQELSGIFNAVAPGIQDQKTILGAMSAARGGFSIPAPAPPFVLRLLVGEMSTAVLASQRVSPQKILDTGYRFRFPDLTAAMQDLYRK